ncbi:alpha/beta hydrolase [Pseudomonas sp. Z8(2022)]|uniref:alpha/beta hydrolase n=1 Tax=Pseudomonas sp. Z8(2022) TaxID=2962597 RepID=UPI0021F3D0C8|nr:alpha/beta hydrolase [Pseudomonas sp. Z8(2022)]UYP29415.1 alpha/beta hydrolase [Pseudomonas sp. Z8(2022)]
MPSSWFALLRRRRLSLLLLACLLVLLPIGCAKLEQTERELVFRIEPGTARWFNGLPAGLEEVHLQSPALGTDESLHAWWWPAARKDAPALLYLHGSRWNLTGQLFRIEQLHALGFSVLAVDYRGFGHSRGALPSERSVYQDALIAWEHLARLQPEADKRFIYGHSLGGAVAVNLAHELAGDDRAQAAGLIVESSFTNLGDVAAAVTNTSLPVRWLLSQEFDSLSKIGEVGIPVLIAHGRDDRYVPSRFSEALFEAASEPKQLLLIEGANHNNGLRMAGSSYRQALQALGFATN